MSARAGKPPLRWLVPALLLGLLPLLIALLQTLLAWPPGSGQPIGINDPDPWLRLTLVRDWLEGGGWYGHRYASNAPFAAMISPWTRPLDLVIAAFTALQPGDAGLPVKLLRTALVLPLFWAALLLGVLMRTGWKLCPMPHAPFALAGLMVASLHAYNYFMPGNADHHALLALLFAWVACSLLTRDDFSTRWLVAAGAALALMLWISPEALLPIAICYGWLGLRWLGGASLRPLAVLSTATAFFGLAALAVERPPAQWFAHQYDTLAFGQLLLLLLAALCSRILLYISSFYWLWRALAAAALLAAAMAALYALDPLFFHGPMALAAPYIHTHFLPRITEAAPLWSLHPLTAASVLFYPLCALGISIRCAVRRNGVIAPASARCLATLLGATTLLTLLQIRWSYYCLPLAVLALAPYLAAWLNPAHASVADYWPARNLRRLPDAALVRRRVPLLALLLSAPLGFAATAALLEKPYQTDQNACLADTRRLIQNGEIDALLAEPSILLAPGELGTEILFFTRHRIVASNYHREGAGIEETFETWKAPALKPLEQTLHRHRVSALVLCPVAMGGEDAAVNRLYAATLPVPPYLTPYTIKTPDLKHPPRIFRVAPTR